MRTATLIAALLAASPAAAQWHVSDEINPLDDTRTVNAVVIDEDKSSVVGARCRSGDLNVIVMWRAVVGGAGERTNVTHRFPPAAAEETAWTVSDDGTGHFHPSPLGFMRQMASGSRLVLQTIAGGRIKTAIFSLAGSRAALSKVADACGLSLD